MKLSMKYVRPKIQPEIGQESGRMTGTKEEEKHKK